MEAERVQLLGENPPVPDAVIRLLHWIEPTTEVMRARDRWLSSLFILFYQLRNSYQLWLVLK